MPLRQDKSEPSALTSSLAGYAYLFLAVGGALMSHFRDWLGILGLTAGGIALLVVGSGRIYRPALTRTPDSITCRYTPWREGSLYVLLVAGPGMAIAMLTQAGGWVRWAAIALFFVVAAGLLLSLREWRRCLLRITPASLTVAVPAHGYALTEIPRERILSIAGGTGARRNGDTGPVTQITYLPTDSADQPATVLIGPTNANNSMWVTVEQSDLLAGLLAWKDGHPRDPSLLNRVDALLRGTTAIASGTGPTAPPGMDSTPYGHPVAPITTAPVAAEHLSAPGGYPQAPPNTAPPADRPSQWRWLRFAAIGATIVAAAAAYPAYQSFHPAPDTEHKVRSSPQAASSTPPTAGAGCSVEGARMVALPKKAAAEPTVSLALTPGWAEQAVIPGSPEDTPNLRALYANDSIRDDDFTPVIQVDLVPTTITDSLTAIAEDAFTQARKMMTVTDEATETVCGSTVYRANTSGYNPDGKGDRSGTTVVTVVEGKAGARWVAVATIRARNTDNPAYIAQHDALVEGFHAGFP